MLFDGSCSSLGSGVGIVLKIPNKFIYPRVIKLEFYCSNNDVEYEVLIQGIILALEMNIENLIVTGDS